MNITDITEADEAQIGLCPCGKGYNGHADHKPEPTLEALRTPGLHYVYPRPLRYPDISAVIYCPLCNCEKSGDVDEPNTIIEPCDDTDCRCHKEEE